MSGLPESGPPNLRTIPSPALRECHHRGLARRGHSAHRRAATATSPKMPRWLRSSRERRAPALWRGGEVQLDRLAAGARARLDGELSAGLEDQRRGLLGAVDADPASRSPCSCNSTCEISVRWSRSLSLDAGSG